jgi:hypothetical protein
LGIDLDTLDEKYKKMLSLGIPMAAVKQRMIMDGIELPTTKTTAAAPPSHMKPPMISAAMLNQVKLKSVCDRGASEGKPAQLPKGVDTKQRVPSLAEIQNALKSLRSVKSNVNKE